jgi:hypothetical protein
MSAGRSEGRKCELAIRSSIMDDFENLGHYLFCNS